MPISKEQQLAVNRAIGERITKSIDKSRLNRNQIGFALGCSGQRVKDWETGTSPKLYHLTPLCDLLGITITWLLTGKHKP